MSKSCPTIHRPKKLTRAERKKMPAHEFAIVHEGARGGVYKSFPLEDSGHAFEAIQMLTRIAGRHGPHPELAREVLHEVKERFPDVYRCHRDLVEKAMKANRVR